VTGSATASVAEVSHVTSSTQYLGKKPDLIILFRTSAVFVKWNSVLDLGAFILSSSL